MFKPITTDLVSVCRNRFLEPCSYQADKEHESFIGANLHDLCTYEPLGSQAEAPSNLYYGT